MGMKARPSGALDMATRSHQRILETLDELRSSAGALADDQNSLEQVSECVSFFLDQAHRHEIDEEQSFFPRLRGKADRALLDALCAEHRVHESLAKEIDALLGASLDPEKVALVQKLARELSASLRGHIAREEAELWPAIQTFMTKDEQAEAFAEMQARRGK
jgi:hemerythrin-like domain-containing protein